VKPEREQPLDRGVSRAEDDQLGYQLFAALFGVAFLIFFAERGFRNDVIDGPVPMGMVVPAAFALGTALRPSSVPLLVGFFLTNTYYLLLGLPEQNTNQTLTFFAGLAVLGSAATCAVRAKTWRISGGELFREFAPLLQLCIVGLYFWTIWHKLNFDFVVPEVSCSRRLSAKLFEYFGAKAPAGIAPAAMVMTLLAEAVLPIGLLFRRTQVATALFGYAFHWMLGLAGFYGFSVTMMALLSIFLMPALPRALAGYDKPRRVWLNRLALLGYVGLMLVAKHALGINTGWLTKYLLFLLPGVVAVLVWLNHAPPGPLEFTRTFREALRHPTWLWVVPIALFLNGMSPYLGFKTEYSYAMYSNLRTEGGKTNHLLWRRPLALFGYQSDLVRVQPGSDPELLAALGERPVTRYELTTLLHRLVNERGRRDIALVLEAEGKTRTYARADKEPELVVEPSFLERKLLRFRAILPPRADYCPH